MPRELETQNGVSSHIKVKIARVVFAWAFEKEGIKYGNSPPLVSLTIDKKKHKLL